MTTKRKPKDRRQRLRISAEAIAAYQADDFHRLHRALGLNPWDCSPLDVGPLDQCPYGPGAAGATSWPLVQELRRLLDAAVADQGAVEGFKEVSK